MSDSDPRFTRHGGEPPLTIESRGRRRGGAPVTLILSVLVLIAIVAVVAYMYRSGARDSNAPPQVLGSPPADVRGAAPPQAATPDPSAGLTISKDDANALAGPPTLAPPPEEPAPPPAPKAIAPPPPPPPDAEAPPAAAPPAPLVKAQTAKAPTAKTAAVKAPTAQGASDTPGAAVVQIGAFSSQSLADREWNKAADVAPATMAGKGKRVVPVAKDGKTLYRTSITGFASREQATSLCDALKAAGGSCFVH
jgi:outer membrane biosynthesis protein TonB